MKVRFSTVATRGFLFFPARRFDQRVANFQIKVILKESLWDQGNKIADCCQSRTRASRSSVREAERLGTIHIRFDFAGRTVVVV